MRPAVDEYVLQRREPTSGRGRVLERAGAVLAVLLFVATVRVDAAVRTAYDTDWVRPSQVEARAAAADPTRYCDVSDCARLENDRLILVYALGLPAAAAAAWIALALWQRRTLRPERHQAVNVVRWAGVVATVAAGTAGLLRWFLAKGSFGESDADRLLALVGVTTALALGAVVVATLVIGNVALHLNVEAGQSTSVIARLGRIVRRQRINLLGPGVLVAMLFLLGQASGQALDAIRAWTLTSWQNASVTAFGLASSALLALVIYESALRLNRPPRRDPNRPDVSIRTWLVWGVSLVVAGGLGVLLGWTGWGLVFAGFALLLLAGAELVRIKRLQDDALPDETTPKPARARVHCELIAIVPLVAVAAAALAAVLDGVLRGNAPAETFWPLAPALLLAGLAIAMTRRDHRVDPTAAGLKLRGRQLTFTRIAALMAAFAALAAVLLTVISDTGLSAVVGFAGFALLAAYALWIFNSGKPRSYGLALALALACGLGTFVSMHLDPHETARVLGSVALVNTALAFLLAVLHYATYASMTHMPPDLLRWFGLEQIPLVFLLLVVWTLSAVAAPEETHDARLVDRVELGGEPPPAPKLHEAFASWRNAQPELRPGAEAGGPPVPMVLLASHGGGIRAAAWTGYALDCIIGAQGSDADKPRTCGSPRRSGTDQLLVARRVFVASGVSGGAVGIQAYAQQTLAGGIGRDDTWVEQRLGRDFAAAAVGWGLFHDLPNDIIGFTPHEGGGCRATVAGTCLSQDRAAVLEREFDGAGEDPGGKPVTGLLRHAWDLRAAGTPHARRLALSLPLVLTNSTVTGGSARSIVSAADLGAWPLAETESQYDPKPGGTDPAPLAGAREVSDMLCDSRDIRLSTAALLGARFPYVSPSGRIAGNCGRDLDEGSFGDDTGSSCATRSDVCETRMVDGGYVDNSGLLSVVALWPELNRLVTAHNRRDGSRPIAPVIVELDNEYQPTAEGFPVDTGAKGEESFIPLATVAGAREAMEKHARGRAYRIRPVSCTMTIAPLLHPGLTAPLGWTLSELTREELRGALVGAEDSANSVNLQRLQRWLQPGERAARAGLENCVPR